MLLGHDAGEGLGVEGGGGGSSESDQGHGRPVGIGDRQPDPTIPEIDPQDPVHGAALVAGAPDPAGVALAGAAVDEPLDEPGEVLDGAPDEPGPGPLPAGPPIVTVRRASKPVIEETQAGHVSIATTPYGLSSAFACSIDWPLTSPRSTSGSRIRTRAAEAVTGKETTPAVTTGFP